MHVLFMFPPSNAVRSSFYVMDKCKPSSENVIYKVNVIILKLILGDSSEKILTVPLFENLNHYLSH